jgi:hypothetical protein
VVIDRRIRPRAEAETRVPFYVANGPTVTFEVHTGSRYGVFPNDDRMSVEGHSRHFDGAPVTSGLPL